MLMPSSLEVPLIAIDESKLGNSITDGEIYISLAMLQKEKIDIDMAEE